MISVITISSYYLSFYICTSPAAKSGLSAGNVTQSYNMHKKASILVHDCITFLILHAILNILHICIHWTLYLSCTFLPVLRLHASGAITGITVMCVVVVLVLIGAAVMTALYFGGWTWFKKKTVRTWEGRQGEGGGVGRGEEEDGEMYEYLKREKFFLCRREWRGWTVTQQLIYMVLALAITPEKVPNVPLHWTHCLSPGGSLMGLEDNIIRRRGRWIWKTI